MLAAAGLLSLAASSQQQDAEDALLPQSEPLDEPSPRDLFRKLFEEPPVREPNEEQLLNGTDEGLSPSGERSKLLITGHAAWKLKPLHGQGEKFCKSHEHQASWTECKGAVLEAVRHEGLKMEHNGVQTISDGKDRPKGCFYDHVHQRAMYNTHHTGGSDTKLHRPVCGTPVCNNNLCGGSGSCKSTCGVQKSLFALASAPGKSMPYYHSSSVTPFTAEPQPSVRLGLIVMHGAQRDGADYFCRLQNSIVKHLGSHKLATEQTILIAPQIALSKHHDEYPYRPIYESHLSWGRTNMVGMDEQETLLSWSAGSNSSDVPSTSLYDVFDELLTAMTDRTMYPNLEKVVIVGHSKGASVVLRYAMTTTIIRTLPVPISFHAANPSALVYVSHERPVPPDHYTCGYRDSKSIASKQFTFKALGESKFAVDAFGTCSQADRWPYGLSGQFPDYVARKWPGGPEGVDAMRTGFLRKHVNIYSGDADTCNAKVHEQLKCYPRSCKMNDCDMETSCAAMYQGVNRMTRIRAYMQQKEIQQSGHKLISIAKSGHNSCIMFQSKQMRDMLFNQLKNDEPYTEKNQVKHEEPSSSVSLSSAASPTSSSSSSSDAAAAAAFIAAAATNGIAAAASNAIAAAATSSPSSSSA